MTVCKFFQQGNCRYGQNCRFDHIYGSKYSYHVSSAPQGKSVFSAPQTSPTQPSVSDEQLVNQVQSDVQSALRGGQWILSCFAPFKEKALFPGISDLSPEESRLFIYEAKANNNLDQAVAYFNNLVQETRQKYEKLLKPDYNIIQVLRSIYKGETVQSPFHSTSNVPSNAQSNTASSIFRSAVQNTSPLNQNTAQSVFSQNIGPPDPAKTLFAQANAGNVFNTNQATSPFAQTVSPYAQNLATSPFAQITATSPFAQNTATSPFAQNTATSPFSQNTATSPFAQNSAQSIFASAVQNTFNSPIANSPSSIFATANQNLNQNASPFAQNVFQKADNQGFAASESKNGDPGVYSKMEDITEDDLEAFKSNSFQLGFVPELPPPLSLCSVTGF